MVILGGSHTGRPVLYKQKTSKYWWFKVQANGRVYRKSTRQTNRRAAAKVECNVRKQLENQATGTHSFSDAALRWIQENDEKRSLKTDLGILRWFSPRLATTYLTDITRGMIEELRQEKLENCSTQTVNRHMALLSAILRKARDDWEWLEKIPKVPMYPQSKRTATFLTWEQFISLQTELPQHLKGPAWLSVTTGLRASSVMSLQWSWIRRDGIRFPPHAMKGGKWLVIPLSLTAWQTVSEQWGKHPDHVFTRNGEPLKHKLTTDAWYSACKRAGIKARFHDLRHTWASWHVQNGTPLHVLQELGGWSSYKMVQVYAHLAPSTLQKWADNVHTIRHTASL